MRQIVARSPTFRTTRTPQPSVREVQVLAMRLTMVDATPTVVTSGDGTGDVPTNSYGNRVKAPK